MCEPSHSIVQFPLAAEHADDNCLRLQLALGHRMQLGKEIDGYYNISVFGVGHSEAASAFSRRAYFSLPTETRYEGHWWNRKVELDGGYHGPKGEEDRALESARRYSEGLCLGSAGKMKEFVTTSFQRTDRSRAGQYLKRAEGMLSDQGHVFFDVHIKPYLQGQFYEFDQQRKPLIANNLNGLLSVRENLAPVWAENDELWIPERGGFGSRDHAMLI